MHNLSDQDLALLGIKALIAVVFLVTGIVLMTIGDDAYWPPTKEDTKQQHRIGLACLAMAVAFPLLLSVRGGYALSETDPQSILIMMGFAFSVLGGMTFGGVGFLESKDQLWIIKSAPNGVRKFAKARIIGSFILILPMAIIPSFASATQS